MLGLDESLYGSRQSEDSPSDRFEVTSDHSTRKHERVEKVDKGKATVGRVRVVAGRGLQVQDSESGKWSKCCSTWLLDIGKANST